MALLKLRQGEPAAALVIIAAVTKHYEHIELQPFSGVALRTRLTAALMEQDSAKSSAAFRDLVRLVVASTGDPNDLRLAAITIGVVEGMLRSELAQSPIGKTDLDIGRKCMLESKVYGVVSAYSAAYNQALERATELERQFLQIQERGIDVIASENEAHLHALNKTLSELATQKDMNLEIFRNSREQGQQNIRDRRKLEKAIVFANANYNRPTPGHPGPERPEPIPLASRAPLPVAEYTTVTEEERVVRNGEVIRITKVRDIRRPQYEIDREYQANHKQMVDQYRSEKGDYDRYITKYRKVLTQWIDADKRRRETLIEQRRTAQERIAELLAESESLKGEQRESAKNFSEKRSAKDQEEFEVEIQCVALAAARRDNIASVFRPMYFPVLTWSQEKVQLQVADEVVK